MVAEEVGAVGYDVAQRGEAPGGTIEEMLEHSNNLTLR
jgi:hypothetical protein